jgi:hypothetical protein
MNLSFLELQRARKRLESFCQQRNGSGSVGPKWCLSQNQSELLIGESTAGGTQILLRLCWVDGRWYLSVPSPDGGWRVYPPKPVAADIESVVAELEQAPLHVHWG